MKKINYLKFLSLAVIALSSLNVVSAESEIPVTNTTNNTNIHIKQLTPAKLDRRTLSMEDRMEIKESAFKKSILNKIERMNEKITIAIDRVEKAETKLSDYIIELKTTDADTSKLETLLADTQSAVASTKTKVEALNSSISELLANPIEKSAKKEIKINTIEANTYIKELNGLYANIMESLKLVPADTATTTDEVADTEATSTDEIIAEDTASTTPETTPTAPEEAPAVVTASSSTEAIIIETASTTAETPAEDTGTSTDELPTDNTATTTENALGVATTNDETLVAGE